MFAGCWSLERALLPNGLENIGEYAFDECVKLSNLELPSGIRVIGNGA